jgi:hypothetical protein
VPLDGFRLGVDFGTSNTVAVLRWPDGRTRPLLFDGSPLLRSAVFAGPGGVLVGRGAEQAGRTHPECLEPHPKRCIDHGRVLLGSPEAASVQPFEVPVEALIGAVLRRVADEVVRTAGGPAAQTTLTHPAGWATVRRNTLLAAARPVFGGVALVPEPVAAASHFVAVSGRRVRPGACVMVYDLGAGTFDASVVRWTATGLDVLATEGLTNAGGLDIDAAVMAYLGATYSGRDAATWSRLAAPATAADRRASRTLWDDVRAGKETLSQSSGVHLHVPLFDDEVPLGREQLEHLARPILDRTVESTRSVLRTAGVPPSHLAGLYLVGGASRIPLAATLLHRALGVPPTVLEQPELAVAEGSLYAGEQVWRPGPAARPPGQAAAAPAPAPAAAAAGGPAPAGGSVLGRGDVRVLIAAASVFALLAAVLVGVLLRDGRDDGRGADGPGGTGTAAGNPADPGAAAGGSAASAPADVDPCLIGTWRERSHVIVGFGVTLNGSGAVHRFRRDGTFRVDFARATPFTTAQVPGYRFTVTGFITAKVRTAGDQIHFTEVRAEGRQVTSGAGVYTDQPLQAAPGPQRYECADDAASTVIVEPGAEHTIQLTRTSTDPNARLRVQGDRGL